LHFVTKQNAPFFRFPWPCCSVRVISYDKAVPRAIAVLGYVAGGLPFVAVLTGHLPANVHGFGAFVLAHVVWCLAVAGLVAAGGLEARSG
jgi:hypothetical protein